MIILMFIQMIIRWHSKLEIYNLKEVHVIPGNSDTTETVKAEMGRQAGQLLEGILYEDAIVSVTGGSTMARVSEAMHFTTFQCLLRSSAWGPRKIWSIKQTPFQQAWHNKQVVITLHCMCQIM